MKRNNWLLISFLLIGFGYTSSFGMYTTTFRRGITKYPASPIYQRIVQQRRFPGIQPRQVIQEQPAIRAYQTSYKPQFWEKIIPDKYQIFKTQKEQPIEKEPIEKEPIEKETKNIDKQNLFNIINLYLKSDEPLPLQDMQNLLSPYKNIINNTIVVGPDYPAFKNQKIFATPLDLVLLKITHGNKRFYLNEWSFKKKILNDINLAAYLIQELGASIAASNSSFYTDIYPLIIEAYKQQEYNLKEFKEFLDKFDAILNLIAPQFNTKRLRDPIEMFVIIREFNEKLISLDEVKKLAIQYKPFINNTIVIDHPTLKDQKISVTPLDLLLLEITHGQTYKNEWLFKEKTLDKINLAMYLIEELGASIAQISNSALYTDIYPLIITKYASRTFDIDIFRQFLNKFDAVVNIIAPTFNTQIMRGGGEIFAIINEFLRLNDYLTTSANLNLEEVKNKISQYKSFINNFITISHPISKDKKIRVTPLDLVLLKVTYDLFNEDKETWHFHHSILNNIKIVQFLIQNLGAKSLAQKDDPTFYMTVYPSMLKAYFDELTLFSSIKHRTQVKEFFDIFDLIMEKIAPAFISTLKEAQEARKMAEEQIRQQEAQHQQQREQRQKQYGQPKYSPPQGKDPYKLLGISHGASKEEIKKAYHEFMKKNHPDILKNQLDQGSITKEKYKEIEDDVKTVNGFFKFK